MRLHICTQVAPQLLLQECSGAVLGKGMVCAEGDLASPRGLWSDHCKSARGEHCILLFIPREQKCRVWQGMGAALRCTAFPPAHPFRPGVAQPLVFCFLFHPLFHITLFFLCFLSHLTCPGATQFTDGRYWIYSPRQRRLRTTSRSSGIVSDHTSTACRGAELQL